MKQYSIKKILFLIIFIIITQQASKSSSINLESLSINNEKINYINRIEVIEKNKNTNNKSRIVSPLKAIAFAIVIAEIYNYCLHTYNKPTEENETTEKKEKKEKNIFEKIEDKITESGFGNFFIHFYNSIMFENNISSLLNNTRMSQLCKEELKERLLILEQTESDLFMNTFFLTLGARKTYNSIKKGFNNCINTALPVICGLFGLAYLHSISSEKIKKEIGNQTSKIDFLEKNEIMKNFVTTSGCLVADHYIITPTFSNLFIYLIEACKEIASKQHKAIKKGKCAKLCSEYMSSKDSKELKKNKEIYEGSRSLIKTVTTLIKIIKNIKKF